MAHGSSPPKFEYTALDIGLDVVDVALAMATKDTLIKSLDHKRHGTVLFS